MNVRNIPTAKKDTGSEVVGQLDEDTVVNITERYQEDYDASEWFYVKASNGIEGWVSGKYIIISDSCPPPIAKKDTNNLASPVKQNKQNNQDNSSDGEKSFWDYVLFVIGVVAYGIVQLVAFLWQYTWGKVVVIILGLALLGKITGGGNKGGNYENAPSAPREIVKYVSKPEAPAPKPKFVCKYCGTIIEDISRSGYGLCPGHPNGLCKGRHDWLRAN